MKANAPAAVMSPLESLTDAHTNLGLACARIARDEEQPWKTRNVFESYAWVIYEQVKALRSKDLGNVPDAYIVLALKEVGEANDACRATLQAARPDKPAQAAAAAVETYQAIDSVDGVLGNKGVSQ